MIIVRTDAQINTPFLDDQLVQRGHELRLLPDGCGQAELHTALSDADLLLMCYTPVTRECLLQANHLQGIVKYGVGIDAIDIATAKERNIVVVNVPDYGASTVAEGAFTLLLALAKKLIPLDRQMHRQGWVWPEPQWMGSDIAGKTIGLIGFG
ncbi:MAG: NAD(P)-dependent oxidoreductase, partial [Pseudomonadota bacterium]